MGAFIIVVLLLMIPIGAFQVISAIIIAIVTKETQVREQFLYYLAGVGVYAILLYPIGFTIDAIGPFYFAAYFFIGAFGLMIYHITILSGMGRNYSDNSFQERAY